MYPFFLPSLGVVFFLRRLSGIYALVNSCPSLFRSKRRLLPFLSRNPNPTNTCTTVLAESKPDTISSSLVGAKQEQASGPSSPGWSRAAARPSSWPSCRSCWTHSSSGGSGPSCGAGSCTRWRRERISPLPARTWRTYRVAHRSDDTTPPTFFRFLGSVYRRRTSTCRLACCEQAACNLSETKRRPPGSVFLSTTCFRVT